MASSLDSKEEVNVIKQKIGHATFISGYSTFLYSAFSVKGGIEALQKVFALNVYFSVFGGLSVVKLGIYGYDLYKAKNKNLGKVGSFFVELIATTFVLLCTIGGFLTNVAFAAFSPWFFIISLMINVAYNLGVCIQNLIQLVRETDKQCREAYKANLKEHFKSAVIVSILTVCMSLIMIFKIVPAIMSIITAVYSGCLFVYGAVGLYQLHKQKQVEVPKEHNEAEELSIIKPEIECQPLLEPGQQSDTEYVAEPVSQMAGERESLLEKQQESDVQSIRTTPVSENGHCYFYRKNRNNISTEAGLTAEVKRKIDSLEKQKKLGESELFSQYKKRQSKIEILQKAMELIKDPQATESNFNALMSGALCNSYVKQSFFRKVGDTEALLESIGDFFARRDKSKQELVTLPSYLESIRVS